MNITRTYGIIAIWSFSCAASIGVAGQDVMLSQPGAMPQFIDPALAGSEYEKQAALLHRQQWSDPAVPFKTSGASYTTRINRKNDGGTRKWFGLGVAFLHDRGNGAGIKVTDLHGSLSYHLMIDGHSSVSAGLLAGFRQQRLDVQDGQWGSQYDGLRYDPLLPSGEAITTDRRYRPDLGAGIAYHFRRMAGVPRTASRLEARTGVAVLHAARPDLAFAGGTDRLHRRYTAFILSSFGSERMRLEPSAYVHFQGSTVQWAAGAMVRERFVEKGFVGEPERTPALAVGCSYRSNGAIVPAMQVEWGEFGIGLSYDLPIDPVVSRTYRAIEFSMYYKVLPEGRR